MTQNALHSEGIVLQASNYGEYDRLLTVFTPEFGVLKLYIKAANSKRRGLQGLCSPLIRAQWSFRPGKGEFDHFREGKVIDPYPKLRHDLEALEAAAGMLRSLKRSQLPGKAAPALYALLATYLQSLHSEGAGVAAQIECSFYIKSLIHEGLLSWDVHCAQCQQDLRDASGLGLLGEHAYCLMHRPKASQSFSAKEMQLLQHLGNSRSLQNILRTPCTHSLTAKVAAWFKSFYTDTGLKEKR
jgi:DNA repair protein RecO (recombination protein O)